jgi:hypothetical protein
VAIFVSPAKKKKKEKKEKKERSIRPLGVAVIHPNG